MVGLRNRCPGVFREFQRGAFTAKKSALYANSLDQAHEQVNALVKGDGGAVTEHPGALWEMDDSRT